jgi:hypothetical protein
MVNFPVDPIKVPIKQAVEPSAPSTLKINPSIIKEIKEQSTQPPIGERVKQQSELTHEEHEFIKKFETPNEIFVGGLEASLGPKFKEIADRLDEDGVVIIPEYFSADSLENIQEFFHEQISKKQIRPFLEQASFNGGVDAKKALSESKAMSDAIADPFFVTLASHHLGHPAVMANWRGYHLGEREPLLYRAWDWHNDQKRAEIKVMILLSDVSEEGQAMQVIKGSHKNWWKMDSQRDTKYSLEEVLRYGKKDPSTQKVTKCYGKAGTIIVFNTNIAHAGQRNTHAPRDVITINYLANIEGMPIFPSPPLHPEVATKYKGSFMETSARIREKAPGENESLLAKKFLEDIETNPLNLKETISAVKIIDEEQDSAPDLRGYDQIPTFSRARAHFTGKTFSEFREFLVRHIADDFGPDLDLAVRLGDKDVKRDIVLAALRDASPTDPVQLKLKDFSELTPEDINKVKSVNLESLSELASDLSRTILEQKDSLLISINQSKVLTPLEKREKIEKCHWLDMTQSFCDDLSEAFLRTDSLERLRTNLIFLRALMIQQDQMFFDKRLQATQVDLMKLHAYVIFNEDSHIKS